MEHPKDFICISCKQEFYNQLNEEIGIRILNWCIEEIPKEITICRQCTENIAIDLMSGSITNPMVLFKIFKGLKKS